MKHATEVAVIVVALAVLVCYSFASKISDDLRRISLALDGYMEDIGPRFT
ncbi:hypothetical protein LCGC14_2957270, partial [marine sediment metagenome]